MPLAIRRTFQRSAANSWRFLEHVKAVVNDVIRLLRTDFIEPNTLQCCLRRVLTIQRSIERALGNFIPRLGHSISLLNSIKELRDEIKGGLASPNASRAQLPYAVARSVGTAGAPRYAITSQQMKFMLQCNFSNVKMSHLFGVSVKTVQRRLRSFDQISNDSLDNLVREHVQCNSLIGANAVCSRIFTHGVKVSRQSIRNSMARVDPAGIALRSTTRIKRRTYSVAGPNSLWHIDGNHKLIRWRIVIHGGIDGFSRLITFMEASSNNKQQTVLQNFIKATTAYGLPSRIRVDGGGENNDICSMMDVLRGSQRRSAIRGTSVHNQRIERCWRDMWNGSTNIYHNLFHFMENRGLLNPDDQIHLWALHFVFLPRINRELSRFVKQWNNHGLRTEHHQSPLQLFVSRMLELSNSQLTAPSELFNQYNISSVISNNALLVPNVAASLHEMPSVSVPSTDCPLSDNELATLCTIVNPLDDSVDTLGISSYGAVLSFIQNALS